MLMTTTSYFYLVLRVVHFCAMIHRALTQCSLTQFESTSRHNVCQAEDLLRRLDGAPATWRTWRDVLTEQAMLVPGSPDGSPSSSTLSIPALGSVALVPSRVRAVQTVYSYVHPARELTGGSEEMGGSPRDSPRDEKEPTGLSDAGAQLASRWHAWHAWHPQRRGVKVKGGPVEGGPVEGGPVEAAWVTLLVGDSVNTSARRRALLITLN